MTTEYIRGVPVQYRQVRPV